LKKRIFAKNALLVNQTQIVITEKFEKRQMKFEPASQISCQLYHALSKGSNFLFKFKKG